MSGFRVSQSRELRLLLRMRRLSLLRLCRRAGVARTLIYEIFHGHRRLTDTTAAKLAGVLGVDPDVVRHAFTEGS
jgi:transcriptional regulator with XRE-family HTH domain